MPQAAGRLAAAAVLTIAAVGGCTSDHAKPAPAAAAVEVNRGRCGVGWADPHGGEQTLRVHNTDSVTMEVELVDPASKGIYAEVESLAAGTTRPIHLVLSPGAYAFACLAQDTDEVFGATVTIKDGPADGAKAVPPVDEVSLTPALKSYRAYVTTGIGTLASAVATVRTALKSGDRARAQKAWLVAQMAYNRLGAAYDTFGDAADAIDGRPDGLPGGVRDKDWTGLLRIEYGLWHGQSLPSLTGLGDRLVNDVAGLRKEFGNERTDANDLPLRAHEILENSLQFELSGAADQGAGDNLATMSANLAGTRAVLDAIAPVIQPRYPGWSTALNELTALQRLVTEQNHGGRWTPVEKLTAADREKLDGALGQLLEDLAPIAAIGEVRRTQ
jgi:iron uptake system EfeUOB component EfeO/EfeM